MKAISITIEAVNEEQIQREIEENTSGWRLFFQEPTGANYEFLQTFWGYKWDGTSETLKEIILDGCRVGDKHKQHLCIFKFDGEDRFVWCSWTREVYDCNTGIKHQLEGSKLALQITNLIYKLI